MLTTYKALLRDNRLEWQNDTPPLLPSDRPVNVHVTMLDEPCISAASQGEQMAAALEQLAMAQAVVDVDAAEWERAARTDRQLPGRD